MQSSARARLKESGIPLVHEICKGESRPGLARPRSFYDDPTLVYASTAIQSPAAEAKYEGILGLL